MKIFLAIVLAAIAAPAASAGIVADADCQDWAQAMLRGESDACDDLCPQALHFDKYDYRAGLKAAYASRTGLSNFIAYTRRSTIMGAGADAQACTLHALLVHWGDGVFSQVASKHHQATKDRVVGLLDYAAVPKFSVRFPRTYSLASHDD